MNLPSMDQKKRSEFPTHIHGLPSQSWTIGTTFSSKRSSKILPELGEKLDPPLTLAHDGPNQMGDTLEDLPVFVLCRLPLQGLDFPYLIEIALVHLLLVSPTKYRIKF